jgi:outer membrane protein assembly factor BamB
MKRICLAVGIILLFVGTNIFPNISGENEIKSTSEQNRNFTTDWWSMFHHDLNHSGYSTSLAPNTNNVLWTYTTSDSIESSPAVANGKLYVGSYDSKFYCLNATTGTWIWRYTTGDLIRSSPAVANGKVYVGSNDDKLYCLNAETGIEIWNRTAIGNIGRSSPAVANGKVYIGFFQQLTCLNADTGAYIWNYTTYPYTTFSSPALANGKIYFGCSGNKTYCLNAETGIQIWNYTTNGPVLSSPVIADGKVYVGSDDHRIYCLNAETGVKIWNYTLMADVETSPAFAYGNVYIGISYKFYCLNGSSGVQIWNYTPPNYIHSSPAVANGKVYFGCSDKSVYCLNAEIGIQIWNYTTNGPVLSSPVIADGKVYVGSDDNNVYCFGIVSNQPPLTPKALSGPSIAGIGLKYNFTANTTDPERDNISYWFDWGDESNSGWLGPIASGATITGSHVWCCTGTFNVTVKAKDVNGAESGVSDAHTISIIAVDIPVITGGLFKVKASIHSGVAGATDIDWKIRLTGGLIIFGKETTGTLPIIPPDSSVTISSKLILGFGKTIITVTAGPATKSQNATVLFFFIKTA